MRLRNDAQMMLAAMEARGELKAPLEYPSELPHEIGELPREIGELPREIGDEPPAKRAMLSGSGGVDADADAADAADAADGFAPVTREAAELQRVEAAAMLDAEEARLAEERETRERIR